MKKTEQKTGDKMINDGQIDRCAAYIRTIFFTGGALGLSDSEVMTSIKCAYAMCAITGKGQNDYVKIISDQIAEFEREPGAADVKKSCLDNVSEILAGRESSSMVEDVLLARVKPAGHA